MWWFLAACVDAPPPCPAVDDDVNCDGIPDADRDGDGARAPAFGGDDCDDADAGLNTRDDDGDGYTTCQGDCEEDPDEDGDRMGPRGVVPELCDNVDNDCNGVIDVDDLGASACEHEVAFALPERVALDLLFVVETNPSFSFADGKLAAAAPALLEPLIGTETHVGVVSTRPGNLGELSGPGTPWLDAELEDLEAAVAWFEAAVDRRSPFAHPSHGLLNATDAIDGVTLPSNVGFRRGNAALAFVFVSDKDDESGYSPDAFLDWLGVSSNADPDARVYGILPERTDLTCGVAEGVVLYQTVLDRTAPGAVDDLTSVCASDWTAALGALGAREAPPYEVWLQLDEEPVPTTIEVEVGRDGFVETLPYEAITYDAFTHRVLVPQLVWSDLDRPPVVRYQVLPPT